MGDGYGYFTPIGFMGKVNGEYTLFRSELEYFEYIDRRKKK